MANLLLLYDTKEKDLARDFNDLFEELNIKPISMIPLLPDKGLTLDRKEKHYFDLADGAIFLITPGSERFGSFFPSPSVSHEMGQAKQKFREKPESIIYLVDEACNIPAIDQRTYIPFKRNDIRSILSALTQLVRDLKSAGLFRTVPVPTQLQSQPKKFNIPEFVKGLNPSIKKILFEISNQMNGVMNDIDIKKMLMTKFSFSVQETNFLLRDMETSKTVMHRLSSTPYYSNLWWLSDLGWAVVRFEIEEKKAKDRETMRTLSGLLSSRRPLRRLR